MWIYKFTLQLLCSATHTVKPLPVLSELLSQLSKLLQTNFTVRDIHGHTIASYPDKSVPSPHTNNNESTHKEKTIPISIANNSISAVNTSLASVGGRAELQQSSKYLQQREHLCQSYNISDEICSDIQSQTPGTVTTPCTNT